MDTIDTSSQPHALEHLAVPDWGPGGALLPLEEQMGAKAATGELVDPDTGPIEMTDMLAWGEERAIRAAVLRHLLVAAEWPVHAMGVRLRGVRITGQLDLTAAVLRCPLALDSCFFDAAEPVNLEYATASVISVANCQLAGVTGTMLRATELDLQGSTFTGRLQLRVADIAGQLGCRGVSLTDMIADNVKVGQDAIFQGLAASGRVSVCEGGVAGSLSFDGACLGGTDEEGGALNADRLKVAGLATFSGGFAASGAVSLRGAEISGDLIWSGATVAGVAADGVKVGQDAFFDDGFAASGSVSLCQARVAGSLLFDGARLDGTDEEGGALIADYLVVGGLAAFIDGFAASGSVSLRGAEIRGLLVCSGATLRGRDETGAALALEGIRARSDVVLDGLVTEQGSVGLRLGEITGRLICNGAQLRGRDVAGWALIAYRLKVGGSVHLRDVTTQSGGLDLSDADIAGQLQCQGARLAGQNDEGVAFFGHGVRVGSDVFLSNVIASGTINLMGADISGGLDCCAAQVTLAGAGRHGLAADRLKVRTAMRLSEFTTNGAIRLAEAEIGAQLMLSQVNLSGRDEDGFALQALRMTVRSDVSLIKAVIGDGAVSLAAATIWGALHCSGARLDGSTKNGSALYAPFVKVRSDAHFDDAATTSGSIDLSGADIGGLLCFTGATLSGRDEDGGYALRAFWLRAGHGVKLDKVSADRGAIGLTQADIAGSLVCQDSTFKGRDADGYALMASGVTVSSDVFFERMTAAGVNLYAADIGGEIIGSGAKLAARDGEGYALMAQRIKAGRVRLDEGFITAGRIDLTGAMISGTLIVRRAILAGHTLALIAQGIEVSAAVLFDEAITLYGAIVLVGAVISGDLRLSGAQLHGMHDGRALHGSWIKVGGDVFFDAGFMALGSLMLASAHFGGSLHVMPEALAGAGKTAVDLSGSRIARALRWAPRLHVRGVVNLEGASAAQLEDMWAPIKEQAESATLAETATPAEPTAGERANGHWPDRGGLELNGFTYRRFGGSGEATPDQRLQWLRSQYDLPDGARSKIFAAQPYEQLVAVYKEAGQDAHARKVAIAKRADLRTYGSLNWHSHLSNWLLEKTIRYGYEAWRAAVGLAVIFVVFAFLSLIAEHNHMIVAVGNLDGLHYVPSATRCTSSYPCFYPIGYAVDTVIPIVDVHQGAFWGPDGHGPWGQAWVICTWVATGLGWALATLLVTGYTGLVRRD